MIEESGAVGIELQFINFEPLFAGVFFLDGLCVEGEHES